MVRVSTSRILKWLHIPLLASLWGLSAEADLRPYDLQIYERNLEKYNLSKLGTAIPSVDQFVYQAHMDFELAVFYDSLIREAVEELKVPTGKDHLSIDPKVQMRNHRLVMVRHRRGGGEFRRDAFLLVGTTKSNISLVVNQQGRFDLFRSNQVQLFNQVPEGLIIRIGSRVFSVLGVSEEPHHGYVAYRAIRNEKNQADPRRIQVSEYWGISHTTRVVFGQRYESYGVPDYLLVLGSHGPEVQSVAYEFEPHVLGTASGDVYHVASNEDLEPLDGFANNLPVAHALHRLYPLRVALVDGESEGSNFKISSTQVNFFTRSGYALTSDGRILAPGSWYLPNEASELAGATITVIDKKMGKSFKIAYRTARAIHELPDGSVITDNGQRLKANEFVHGTTRTARFLQSCEVFLKKLATKSRQ